MNEMARIRFMAMPTEQKKNAHSYHHATNRLEINTKPNRKNGNQRPMFKYKNNSVAITCVAFFFTLSLLSLQWKQNNECRIQFYQVLKY